jgi:hypothetical protein
VLRWLSEGERAQLLVEQGIDPLVAQRAVRYGRGDALAADASGPAEPA